MDQNGNRLADMRRFGRRGVGRGAPLLSIGQISAALPAASSGNLPLEFLCLLLLLAPGRTRLKLASSCTVSLLYARGLEGVAENESTK